MFQIFTLSKTLTTSVRALSNRSNFFHVVNLSRYGFPDLLSKRQVCGLHLSDLQALSFLPSEAFNSAGFTVRKPSQFCGVPVRAVVSATNSVSSEYWDEVFRHVADASHSASASTVEPAKFSVLEIHRNCSLQQVVHTPRSLGIHSRDVSLFASKRSHAAISPRGKTILFINDMCRALLTKDKVVLFPCRRRRHTATVAEAIISRLRSHADHCPFELNVLEALMSSTVSKLYSRARQLSLLVNIVTSNTESFASPDFQSLLPLQQTVSELHQDVKELQEATAEVLRDDKTVASLTLSEQAGPANAREEDHSAMAAVLSSYQLQIQVIEGMFEEMQEQLANARDVTQMQLSAKRNYIIQTNMVISIANLALLNCTIVAGFFGMNLLSGIEDVPGVFPAVVMGSVMASALCFTAIYSFVAWRPRRKAQDSIRQLSALRSLVANHIDDLDDIIAHAMRNTSEGSRGLRRPQFHLLAWEVTKLRSKPMSQEEVDLLFDFFDYDRTGVVEAETMDAMYEKLCEQPDRMDRGLVRRDAKCV